MSFLFRRPPARCYVNFGEWKQKKVKKVTFPHANHICSTKRILTSCPWRFPGRYGHVAYGKVTSGWKWWLPRLEQKSELPTSKSSFSGAQLFASRYMYLSTSTKYVKNPMEQNKESQIYHGLPSLKLTHPCAIRARKKRPLVSEVGLWLVAFTKNNGTINQWNMMEYGFWGISKPIQSIQPTRFEIVQPATMIWKLLSWFHSRLFVLVKTLQVTVKALSFYRGAWKIIHTTVGTTHPISPHLGNKALIRPYGIMVVNNPLTRPSFLGGWCWGSAIWIPMKMLSFWVWIIQVSYLRFSDCRYRMMRMAQGTTSRTNHLKLHPQKKQDH